MSYNSYRSCIVSNCKSTTIKTPEKLFIMLPFNVKMRNIWLELSNRDPKSFSSKSNVYLCEDHFDLEKDMENYMEYKIMGSVKRIRMKPNIVPSRFKCYSDKKHIPKDIQSFSYIKEEPTDLIQDDEGILKMKDCTEPSISSCTQGFSPVQRRKSCTIKQLELLASFCEKYPQVVCPTFRGKEHNLMRLNLWKKGAVMFNKEGPSRTASQWIKFFTDYKAKLRNKLRRMIDLNKGLADLSPNEEKIVRVIMKDDKRYNIKTEYKNCSQFDVVINNSENTDRTDAEQIEDKESKEATGMNKKRKKAKRESVSSTDTATSRADINDALTRIETARLEVDKLKVEATLKLAEAQNRIAAGIENLGAGLWALVAHCTDTPIEINEINIVRKKSGEEAED